MMQMTEVIKKYKPYLEQKFENGKFALTGRIGFRASVPANELAWIRANRDQLWNILFAQHEEERKAEEERRAKIDAIPGLKTLKSAIDDLYRYQKDFEAMMCDEYNDGAHPPKPPLVTQDELDDLFKQFPRAAAYIKAERWSLAGHYVKSGAGKRALERIINGESADTAIRDMEEEWNAHLDNHMWD